MLQSACLEVRVLPWRPRRRVSADNVREGNPLDPTYADHLAGAFVMLGL